jgi:hypothetical protein
MLRRLLLALALFAPSVAFADIAVRESLVVISSGASPQETFAAHELRDYLSQITGVDIPIVAESSGSLSNAIVVGTGPLARRLLPGVSWDSLGGEQTLVRSAGNSLVVAGGRQRGTLYAVYRLLQKDCGVRWWAPWATTVPSNHALTLGKIDESETPAFEFRDPYWAHSFDANWAARNFDNGFNVHTDDAHGGKTLYAGGFVHTFNGLVPPDKEFSNHPEWFSLINGVRTASNAQLCTTNPELRKFIVQRVIEELKANPQATIVSVSQNDCYNPCQCPVCRELAKRQGSDAALVLDLANYVADQIKDQFPKVAVDTLAYQWSRHPPISMKPRPNVIVRLCSIECNFAQPLYAPSNQAFADDIRGWNKLTKRLYVWDYCTDFANYLQPQPDYFSLGPTLAWLSKNGAKGVFEEGDYTSSGGDMAELKAWVIAQMLWDPNQDPDALVDEFLKGYYGAASGPIREYLKLMTDAAQGAHVSFAMGGDAPFLNYDVMSQARKLWSKALDLVSSDPQLTARVRMSALSEDSVWLSHWQQFRLAALAKKETWPAAALRQAEAQSWLANAQHALGLIGYPAVTAVDEGGTSPRAFIDALGAEPPGP